MTDGLVGHARELHRQLGDLHIALDGVSRGRERRAACKLIATIALALEARRGVRRPRAIKLATRVVADALESSVSVERKIASEARALIDFALRDTAPAWRGETDVELLTELDRFLEDVSVADALRSRAEQLARTRGGRPPKPSSPAVAALRQLIASARAGDGEARAELVGLYGELQGWTAEVLAQALEAARPADVHGSGCVIDE